MALTTTQINQAYIAILGRAAIGTESRVAGDASVSDVAASLIADKVKNGDKGEFATLADKVLTDGNGLNNSDFVESLYLTLLNRDTENDAEGKAFWLSALNNGASRKDLVASFTNAVIAQKAANTQDYQNYAAKAVAQSDAFVESLYTKLLGRTSDESGKAYWSGLIADGASYADVVASFAAAAFSQGKGTEDGVTIANKLEVADYATASITAFSKLATEQNIQEVKDRIGQMITSTDKDSTAETIAESKKAIDSDANTFKAPGSVTFTTKADDKLGIDANGDYNTTKATDFNGSLNLDDDKKGTIQVADKVYGNIEFANGNILTVNVTGTTNNKTLDLNKLPGTISGVNNLEIKAGTAQVTGTINPKFTNTVTINAGYTGEDNKQNASDITVAHKLDTYNAGAKADQLTVASGASIENVDMGAGNDTIILQASNGVGNPAAKVVNIDAGAGTNDILQLTAVASVNAASGDYTSIQSITGVETIKLTVTNQNDTASISYDAIKESNKAFNLISNKADSGDLTIKAGNNKDIDVSKIVNGTLNKETGALENKVATLTISDVKADATIRLEAAADGNKLVDKITLHGDVDNGELGATIINFASGDKISVLNDNNTAVDNTAFAKLINNGTAYTKGTNASGDLTSAVGSVKSVSVTNKGVLTFFDKASTEGGGANEVFLTSVADVQKVIKELSGVNKLFNGINNQHAAVIAQIGKDAYIIETGASESITTDDTVIKLSGVIIGQGGVDGISVASNAVTLA